jgi:hypothetical protein
VTFFLQCDTFMSWMARISPPIVIAIAIAMGGCALVTSFDVEDGTATGGTGPEPEIPCTAPTDCPSHASDGACQETTCEMGLCQIAREPNGTPCPSDGVFCNGEESCAEGSCVSAGDPCDGADDDDDCSEQCDEAAQSCDGLDPDGAACDDGMFCNGTDACQAGDCSAHAGNPCPGPNGNGNCAESCDENADTCTAPDPDGSLCDDGLYCNGVDSCVGGTCELHGPQPCDGPGDPDFDCWETCREDYDDCNGMDRNGSACVLDNEPACCLNGGCSPLAC